VTETSTGTTGTAAHDDVLALADRFFAAIAAGDIEALEACYADDAVIWHNFDQAEQTRAENLRTLGWVTRNVADLRYEEVRRIPFDGGFVQQHVLRGTTPSGADLEVPAMLRIDVRDGLVRRVEEYLDTAHVAELMPRRSEQAR
jgi:ketosteroid isomerase-like protein